MTAEPLLSARELAAYLGVNVDTVYQKAQTGEIPVAFRVGPPLIFDREAVLAAQVDTSDTAEDGSDSAITAGVDTAVDTSRTPTAATPHGSEGGSR